MRSKRSISPLGILGIVAGVVCLVVWWIWLKPPIVWGATTIHRAGTTARSRRLWSLLHGQGDTEYNDAFDRPLNFYGLVVDQQHNPVAGATVELKVNDNPTWGDGADEQYAGSAYRTKSDAQGRFAVTGMRGSSIYVEALKDGYYTSHHESAHTFAQNGYSIDRPMPKNATDPAIFVIHKKGQPTVLIQHEISAKVDGKGAPTDIDLRTGRVSGDGQNNLRIEMTVGDELSEPYKQFDWHCRISAPGGGLQSYEGDFIFTAPSDGYQPEEVFEKSKDMPRGYAGDDPKKVWSGGERRRYFIKTPSGNYARVRLSFHADPPHVWIEESFLNITGSTNLENGEHGPYGW